MTYQDDKVVIEESVYQTIINEVIQKMVNEGSEISATVRETVEKHLGHEGLTGDAVYNIKHEVIMQYPKPTMTEQEEAPKTKKRSKE